MQYEDWRTEAYRLYFDEHMEIVDIAREIDVSRQHIGKYLKDFTRFKIEKEHRKKINAVQRKEKKKFWDRCKRTRYNAVDADTMKREHEQAVMELSHEKY